MISNSGKFFINWRQVRVWTRKHKWLLKYFLVALAAGSVLAFSLYREKKENPAPIVTVTPTPKWIESKVGGEYREDICEQFEFFEVTINGEKEQICPKPTQTIIKIVPTTSPKAPQRPTSGKASYYSVDGCLGCSDTRTMANGQRLDDTRATVAYNHLPLNTPVKITNVKNGLSIVVPVTDRGGFERHGKIADLSFATKEALQCGDVCTITIWEN